MKRILTISLLLLAVLSCRRTTPVMTSWRQICEYRSHDTDRLFQGLLYKDGELFQFFDGGTVNVLDAGTMDFKRSFRLPYPGHYSTVEWLDGCRFATTDYECNLYVTDISDERNMTCDTVHMAALDPVLYTKMAALSYDRDRKILYVSGYGPDKTFRADVVTSELDLSSYIGGTSRDMPLLSKWAVPSYHIQDGCFHKGFIWHLADKTIGQASSPYDCLAVYVLDPKTRTMKTRLDIPLGKYTEAQGFAIVDDNIVLSDVLKKTLCRYYGISVEFSDGEISEESALSPHNAVRNSLCSNYALYDFLAERVNKPAPEGYEPFYMVHYGRHGARYLSDGGNYELIHDVFSSVPDEGLTPLGRALAARYETVYPELCGRGGDLSGTGKRELALLGRRYLKDFPQILRKGATVLAECSKLPRCIVSAAYFCDELDDAGCEVDLNVDSALADGKIRRKWYPAERDAYVDSLLRASVDIEGICRRLFVDGSKAVSGDAATFVKVFWEMSCDMPLTHRPELTFTPAFAYRDLVALNGLKDAMYRYGRGDRSNEVTEYSRVLLDHLFAVAADDISTGRDVSARLFFGHDTPLMSLMCLLNPEGWAENWKSSDIPMAANLRIVFYRKGDDVIYKIQLNESDITDYREFRECQKTSGAPR